MPKGNLRGAHYGIAKVEVNPEIPRVALLGLPEEGDRFCPGATMNQPTGE
jgi:hypothetical protein